MDYKYILILPFLKRISDKWELDFEETYKKFKSKGMKDKEARDEAKGEIWHDFNLPEEYLWENIRKDKLAKMWQRYLAKQRKARP